MSVECVVLATTPKAALYRLDAVETPGDGTGFITELFALASRSMISRCGRSRKGNRLGVVRRMIDVPVKEINVSFSYFVDFNCA